MQYLKDINILGYIDTKGDIGKVSKISLTNQIVKNLLNQRYGDSRLSDDFSQYNIDTYKYSENYVDAIVTNSRLVANIQNKLKQIKEITITPTRLADTVLFDISYTISDNISKNLQTSTFKFSIDK
jgi:hypothetical protein